MNIENDLKLHIIGGFLGSGKTTAIISAARYLAQNGKKVGVITNDQGKHLVDTAILRGQDLPAMEVTGGCFCCHFDDLNDRLKDLVDEHHPDVIFAESVGSCADVVATVVRPLLEMEIGAVKPNSYTVFADVRLLRRLLLGQEMPFSDGINYIFGKQIEEAGLLLINKVDLIDNEIVGEVVSRVNDKFPHISAVPVSALDDGKIVAWVDALQAGKYPPPVQSLEIDYDRYADGEHEMAWVDREYKISANQTDMPDLLLSIVDGLKETISANKWSDGHIKLVVSVAGRTFKVSLAQSGDIIGNDTLIETFDRKALTGDEVVFLINILIPGDQNLVVDQLERIIKEKSEPYNVSIITSGAFERKPGYPKPTYRIAN